MARIMPHKLREFAKTLPPRMKSLWASVVLPWLKELTVKKVVYILFVTGLTGTLFVVFLFVIFSFGLPPVETLKDYQPLPGTVIYGDDGKVLGRIKIEKGIHVPLDRIPKFLKNAVLATEDPRFYEHKGLDYRGILRAALKDIIAVRLKQGGSTITQQLTKVVFLTPRRSVQRKIKEVILARRLEKEISKDEILEHYLNRIYFGQGAYGVQMAARTYFGKNIWQINEAEAALLAGLPKAPVVYSPYHDVDLTKLRQRHVLGRMVEEEFITEEQSEEIYNKPVALENLRSQDNVAPHIVDHLKQYIEETYGPEMLYQQGMKVYTSINVDMQRIAVRSLKRGLRALDKRQGFRGRYGFKELKAEPIQQSTVYVLVKPGEIFNAHVLEVAEDYLTVKGRGLIGKISHEDMAWALLKPKKHRDDPDEFKVPAEIIEPGDIVKVRLKSFDRKKLIPTFQLDQKPLVEGAVVAIEPFTGYVRVMVGGYDFVKGGFNHATDAYRQPGSAFKPFIYGAALENGYTPASILMDLPVIHDESEEEPGWKPQNYDKRFLGPMRLRMALAKSRNTATVRLLEELGLRKAVNFARKVGITSPINDDYTAALGSSSVTPVELTSAFATFASQGVRSEPIVIKSIVDAEGNVLESYEPNPQEVLDRNTAFLITSLLESVVQDGTGRGAKWIERPLAGKTGTTNNYVDAWFLGFSPSLVAGVWVGYDNASATLGDRETGARAALPIWSSFMFNVHKNMPIEEFMIPEEVVERNIDAETGLLAQEDDPEAIIDYFLPGTEPTEFAEAAQKQKAGQFYQLDQMEAVEEEETGSDKEKKNTDGGTEGESH
ncbi:MAG TPA: penicillin-binding protein [Nitrospiraceae bacterium]|nr:penicillin-binding protein [Nitrospiraceae bacterium]